MITHVIFVVYLYLLVTFVYKQFREVFNSDTTALCVTIAIMVTTTIAILGC